MNKLTRILLAVVCLNMSIATEARAADKPNILIIWGDDIGPYNISAYNMGRMGYKTPNIDKIAADGIIFTDSYGVLGILPPNTAKTAEVPVFTGLQATINFNLAQVSVSSSAFGSKNEQNQATINSHCR